MVTIVKAALSVLLLVFVASVPMACLTINKTPDDQPTRTEVNVGGEHGVTVEHK